MPDPTRAQFHVDGPLSDISVAYMQDQEDYIADQIFPVVEVDKQSDLYFVWTKGFWMRNVVERRAGGDEYPEGRLELSTDNYYCNLYHLGYGIPDESKSGEDPGVELEITGSEWLASQFLLNREITIAADIFVDDVWGTTADGGVDFTLWDDYDDSNPVSDVNTAKQTIQKATGKKANTLVMGKEVFDILTEHPILLDKYKHTSAGILDQEEIRRALKVDKLVVGEAVYESTAEGGAGTTGYIWGKNALLCHVPARPGLRVAAAGYTFTWRLEGAGRYTVAISNTRQDWRDRDLLKGKHAFDHKIVGTDLGYFFSAAVA